MDLTPEPRSFLLVDVRRTDWEVRSFHLTFHLIQACLSLVVLISQRVAPSRHRLIFQLKASIKLARLFWTSVIELRLNRSFSTVVSSPLHASTWTTHWSKQGSSNGRGPRCASWFQDYIDDVSTFGRKTSLQVLTLKGGIKGWVKDFEGALVDGFEEKYWEPMKYSTT